MSWNSGHHQDFNSPKLIYRINIIPVKVQGGFFSPKFHKLTPKLKCRFKVPIAKTNLKGRSK